MDSVPLLRASSSVGLAAALLAALGGCVAYHPAPLDDSLLPGDVAAVAPVSSDSALPELRAQRFDPADGLDATEVAILAVANNPDLRVARAEAGVVHAQAFAAGLLPDPQLSFAQDFPDDPGLVTAFALGLSEDLGALITRAAKRDAADAGHRQADRALLWQEWQVVAQARLLVLRTVYAERLRDALEQAHTLLAGRDDALRRALQRGDLVRDTFSSSVSVTLDFERQLAELTRQSNQTRQDLAQLVGVAPGTPLHLVGEPEAPAIDADAVQAMLARLPQRRPDLLALRDGYTAQEAQLRGAVLAQFPALTVGVNRARDTSNVFTSGLSVTLSIPLFNRNRGNIAIESATRSKLGAEYRARLSAARAEIARLLEDLPVFDAQAAQLQRSVAELEDAAQAAQRAYDSGLIDLPAYAAAQATWLARRVELLTLEQNRLEQRLALFALLGAEPPPVPLATALAP